MGDKMTEADAKLAAVLGWCIEWVSGVFYGEMERWRETTHHHPPTHTHIWHMATYLLLLLLVLVLH